MITLASQSPRRAQLLEQLGVPFQTQSADIDEAVRENELPSAYVSRMATEKATRVWQSSDKRLPVLGSDTICVLDDEILVKPKDKTDSLAILSRMSGRIHLVLTSVAICSEQFNIEQTVTTEVEFKSISSAEMEWYWQTGEPQDKAGSYGIQGLGGRFVKRINGSYSAVVGLPLYETSELLKQCGVSPI